MRNAITQRIIIMGCGSAMQQPSEPHVSHAQKQISKYQPGQRCALLTTKSRNTCTRATVFNSSG
jgi:hypothetical protein